MAAYRAAPPHSPTLPFFLCRGTFCLPILSLTLSHFRKGRMVK
jgi:hypothetical protein